MKWPLSLVIFLPVISFAQLPDSILNRVRTATLTYSIQYQPVPVTGSRTLPCLDVKINGKKTYRFLIDLGSNVVLFKRSVVQETGMNVLIGRSSSDIVKADRLEIGNTVFTDVHGAAYENLDVDGVLGFNILGKANFFIDYPNLTFGFIEDVPRQRDSSYVKYELMGRMPYIKSKIGNRDLYINFDTGATLWLYFPQSLKDSIRLKTPLRDFKEMSNNQTGRTMTYLGQINDDILLGNYRIVSPNVIFDPDIDDAFVGSSLLSEFKLSFYPSIQAVKMERNKKGDVINIPEDQRKN